MALNQKTAHHLMKSKEEAEEEIRGATWRYAERLARMHVYVLRRQRRFSLAEVVWLRKYLICNRYGVEAELCTD